MPEPCEVKFWEDCVVKQDAVNDLRNVFEVLGEDQVTDDQLTDILKYKHRQDNQLLAMHREFVAALPGSITSEDLIAAVRGMSYTQRMELAGLLGIPAPRHPFLWLPSDGDFSDPTFPGH